MTAKRSPLQSLITFRNSQGEAARGTLLKLERSVIVFEVYNPYSIVQLSEVLSDITIRRGERVIYRGRAVVSNLVNTGLLLIVSGTLIDSWTNLAGLEGDVGALRSEAEQFVEEWQKENALQAGYLVAVTEIRGFLSDLHRWLGQLDVPHPSVPSETSITDEAFQEICEVLFPRMYALFARFEAEAKQVPPDSLVVHKQYAQRDLHPLLLTAPFVHRTFTKPLGYAGDFEMVNMMLRERREGPSTYAQLINVLHLGTGVAQAHRNRIRILKRYLIEVIGKSARSEEPIAILNVGCGPAQELQDLIRTDPQALSQTRCRFELIDFNSDTLAYTETMLASLAQQSRVDLHLKMRHQSVHELLKQAIHRGGARTGMEGLRFIYCAGLFDYLSDKVCNRLLRLFYEWLAPGGMVVATNVHPTNPSRQAMEHILEWHLIHRDEERMRGLLPHVGQQRVFADETGVNVFLEITKSLPPYA